MNAKQFAWLYLVEHGFCGVRSSYYGGYEPTKETMKAYPTFNPWDRSHIDALRQASINILRDRGVDWDKTEAPINERESEFNGTFNEPGHKEVLTGRLVLKDGTRQEWIADALEVGNVFEMMAAVHDAEKRFKGVFE